MNNNNDKNNNLTKYVLSFCPNFNLFFVSVKIKKGKFIALCQEDCKQDNSCTFIFYLTLKYSPSEICS